MAVADRNMVEVVMLDEEKERKDIDAELIEEYASFLGIDTEYDRDLFWIAKSGLEEHLPEPWRACQIVGSEDIFYYNSQTQESAWNHPCDDIYMKLLEKERESRVIMALTLTCEQSDSGIVLAFTNMAGMRKAEVSLEAPEHTCVADALRLATEQMSMPEKTVPRFILADGTMLGYSSNGRMVSQLFGLN